MRVLLDANVLVSALLSRMGAPARLLRLWADGELELVVCPALIGELERTLARPRLRSRVDPADAERLLALLAVEAESVPDPEGPPPLRSAVRAATTCWRWRRGRTSRSSPAMKTC